jgi:hypothetical protein
MSVRNVFNIISVKSFERYVTRARSDFPLGYIEILNLFIRFASDKQVH